MNRQEIINNIEHDNNRINLYNRVLPIILGILDKYNGKQYGEKTRAKMSAELREKCNCTFYLGNSYHEDITIIPLNAQGYSGTQYKYNDFNVYCNYPLRDERRPLDANNTIHGFFKLEDFHLSNCNSFIPDPEKHADDIITKFDQLKEQYADLERNITIFNNMLPSSIEQRHIQGFRNYL